jgi:O-antigen/teichoic acid export membrane protein
MTPAQSNRTTPPRKPPHFTSAALYTYATQLGAAALSLVNIVVVSRALGPTGRGDVAFLTTVPQLSANFVMLGVQEANANFAAAEPKLRRALATNSLLLAALFGTTCVAALVGLVHLVPGIGGHVDRTLLWVALGSIPFLVLQVYLQFLITADYRFRVANNTYLITPLLNVAINGVLAATSLLTVGRAYGTWFAGQLLATAFFVWYVGRRICGYGRPERSLAARAIRFGFRSYLGRTMMFGSYRLDQWLLGAIAGSRELGLYSIAVAWSEVLFYLPTSLVLVQRPYLVRASLSEAGRRAALVFRAGLLLTIPLAGGLVLVAPFLATRLFGSGFSGATSQLRVLALGAFGIVALKQLANALTAQRRPGLGSVAVALTLVATIALDVLLIPSHGAMGAAIASTFAYSIGGAAIVVMFLRIFRLPLTAVIPALHDVVVVVREGRSIVSRRPRVPTGVSAPAVAEDSRS